jgi:hypothetical protein
MHCRWAFCEVKVVLVRGEKIVEGVGQIVFCHIAVSVMKQRDAVMIDVVNVQRGIHSVQIRARRWGCLCVGLCRGVRRLVIRGA